MSDSPRFLIVDGYTKQARDELAAGGASVAGELYAKMLEEVAPGADCDVLYPSDAGAVLPQGAALAGYDGVAWTGCSLTVMDDVPEVRCQIDLARAGFEAGVPAFGSCWAAQIAVVAAGGTCAKNPRGREMGIARKIALTPDGRAHPMYDGKRDLFDAFISHDDEVTALPDGARRLAGNAFSHIQAVSVEHKGGTFWGLQYHPEYDLHEMARLTWCRIDKMVTLGFFKDRQAGEAHVAELEALAEDPGRKDLAWKLGVDDDVTDTDFRRLEVRNWIDRLVKPAMAARR